MAAAHAGSLAEALAGMDAVLVAGTDPGAGAPDPHQCHPRYLGVCHGCQRRCYTACSHTQTRVSRYNFFKTTNFDFRIENPLFFNLPMYAVIST